MLGLLRKYIRELLVYERITREDFEDIEGVDNINDVFTAVVHHNMNVLCLGNKLSSSELINGVFL